MINIASISDPCSQQCRGPYNPDCPEERCVRVGGYSTRPICGTCMGGRDSGRFKNWVCALQKLRRGELT